MTREEIMALNYESVETRAAAIAAELEEADAEKLEILNEELDALTERKAQLDIEIAEQKKAAEAVVRGAGTEIEERKENMMEIRNTREYIEAYANAIKHNDLNFTECRTLLTDNASGTVPVPEFVADVVAERVKESKILSRVRKMYAAGNVKVGFEISAPAAAAHTEGGDPVTEEALALGIVEIVPTSYKKWVQISDEALDSMAGEAYLTYLYEEVTRGIIKAQENAVVAAILAAPQTATSTAPAVAKTGSAAGAITDFVDARSLLSSAAEDLVVICSPADYATYRGLQMAASYGVDPFDGCEVLFSDAATKPIIGDLSGVMVNYPKGEAVEFKYDDKTLMTSDLVNVLGRQPAGIAVVGNLFFAKVSA